MATRYDVERALESSDLPAVSVSIVLWLCTRMARGGTEIPAGLSPSLSRLAKQTKHHRRTIMRHLIVLESAGWITRSRPGIAKARSQHRTTHYTVIIPDTIPGYPQPDELGAGNPEARGRKPPDLGAGCPKARGTVPHETDQTDPLQIRAGGGPVDVAKEIEKRTGKRVTPEWAAKVRDQLAGEPGVRHPARYVVHRIKTDPDPKRFLPTDQPPAMAPGWERGPG
jgi:hypothetical protein